MSRPSDETTRRFPLFEYAALAGLAGRLGRTVVAARALLLTCQQRAITRTRLASVDDRLLRNMGMSREQAARESAKTFWRA